MDAGQLRNILSSKWSEIFLVHKHSVISKYQNIREDVEKQSRLFRFVSLSIPETLTCEVVFSCPRVRLSGVERDAWPT